MKRILALALLASSAFADQVTIAWDASISTNVTYIVYANPVSGGGLNYTNRAASVVKVNVGTNLLAVVQNVTTVPMVFAVTASRDGLESQFSNLLLISVPFAPTNVRVGP